MSLHTTSGKYLLELCETLEYNDPFPTEADLARQMNVSRTTIRRALGDLVDWHVITRIPKRGTFVNPKSEWRVPVEESLRSGLMGLIVPSLDNAFDRRLVSGFLHGAEEKGIEVVVRLSEDNLQKESQIIEESVKRKYQGLAVFPCENELVNNELVKYKLEHYPLVLIDRWFPGIAFNSVRTDNYLGGVLAATWLLQQGFHRISIIARHYREPGGTETVRERIRGIEDTVIRSGEPVLRDSYCFGQTLTREEFRKKVYEKIIDNPDVDAVITIRVSDAHEFYDVLRHSTTQRLGWASFDSWHDYPSLFSPLPDGTHAFDDISWVDQSEWEVGRIAALSLAKVIQDPTTRIDEILPVKLQTSQGAVSSSI